MQNNDSTTEQWYNQWLVSQVIGVAELIQAIL